MAGQDNRFLIWQWNCAGFLPKKAVLQQFVLSCERKPHVIVLQETLRQAVSLQGYRTHSVFGEGRRGICFLVSKQCSFVAHSMRMDHSKVEHSLIEIIPNAWLKSSIFILNIYSSPRGHRHRFASLVAKAAGLAAGAPFVVAGDFNAPHCEWGYPSSTVKGSDLWQTAADHALVLLTDPSFPTRTGTSITRDSTPDLTFVKGVGPASWRNLHENLGSDHFVLAISFEVSSRAAREFRVTDWDLFRKIREGNQTDPADFNDWLSEVKRDVESATKTVRTDLKVDRMDSRLAHLLEAKAALLARWKQQRLNRRLRKRIAELNRTIEDHCQSLAKQQWDELCNSVDGQMRTGGKWNLLKHLLDESASTSNQRLAMDRVLHESMREGSTVEDIFQSLADRYLPMGPSSDTDYPLYRGRRREDLDAPFTENDVWDALLHLNGRSAPGPDGISNRLLRNLDGKSIATLTDEINRVWDTGDVPDDWKIASVVLIPKPGRTPGLQNMRPISLTSCVGKVAEHVIHNRISRYIEECELFPYNMMGFRPSLSTQDVMKLLKHEIIDKDTRDVRGILALDLEKAFDTVLHRHVLDSISDMDLGCKFHGFVTSFLRGRCATLKVGAVTSDPFELGARGTPQGSVISPLLFNVAVRGLSVRLSKVDGVNHALYADDITVWCDGGSEGRVEDSLQAAVTCTEEFLEGTGLRLSPSKSELLLYRPTRRGRIPKGQVPLGEVDISIRTAIGQTIPRVEVMRVLGMLIEANGCNGQTIARIATKTNNMVRLITRVSNSRGGLREENLLRLYHAFLMSHITYVAAAHRWHGYEKAKLEALMRKSIKKVLGIPMCASTEKLMQLGVHNTLDEVVEAQQTAQVARLSSSPAGRRVLEALGCNPTAIRERRCALDAQTREAITILPFPRNVHPQHNVGRRRARAAALLKSVAGDPHSAAFVDAAQYGSSDRFVATVVDYRGNVLNAASVRGSSPALAEQVAVALALQDGSRPDVYTDSRAAVRAFASGSVSMGAASLLCGRSVNPHVITWFPAHMGPRVSPVVPNANELAHARARELTHRAGETPLAGAEAGLHKDSLHTFNEITQHYKLSRRVYPPPHTKLSRPQGSTLRMLQTRSYPSLARISRYADSFEPDCPDCGDSFCNLEHMLWRCPSLRNQSHLTTMEEWEAALKSTDLATQLRAVQRACSAAVRHGLPVPTWELPAAAPPP